jgi:hypothetical protein
MHHAQDAEKKKILTDTLKNRKNAMKERGIELSVKTLFGMYSIE